MAVPKGIRNIWISYRIHRSYGSINARVDGKTFQIHNLQKMNEHLQRYRL